MRATEEGGAPASFASLPHPLQLRIALLCPADQRVRMTFVCAEWRAALSEPLFWADVNLSPSSGACDVTDGLLRVLAAKARGEMRSLDVSRLAEHEGGRTASPVLSDAALLHAVTANARSLQRLRVRCVGDWETVLLGRLRPLLTAVPRLQRLEADVHCTPAESTAVLRNEAPFGALRLRRLWLLPWGDDVQAVLTLADALPAHASLEELVLDRAPLRTPAVFDALVHAALSARLTGLRLKDCALSPTSLAGLTRLLRDGRLAALDVRCGGLMLEEGRVPALCAALRSSTTLTSLGLSSASLWRSAAVGVAVMDELVGHPTVQSLSLSENRVDYGSRTTAGAALGRLVAADAPALTALDVSGCSLGDHGLGSLVRALPGNTHLRKLDCRANHGAGDPNLGGVITGSPAFAGEVLRALRANTALEVFQTDSLTEPFAGEVMRAMRAARL